MSVRLILLMFVLTPFLGGCMSLGYDAIEVSAGSHRHSSAMTIRASDSIDHMTMYEERIKRLRESQARHARPRLLNGTNAREVFSVRISGCFSKKNMRLCINNTGQMQGQVRNGGYYQSPGLRNTTYCQTDGRQDTSCYGYFQKRAKP